jgi:hypothetical protein
MPTPSGNDNKGQASRNDTSRTYKESVKVGDPGGATESNPHPTRPFINPNPGSPFLNDEWSKRSC